MVHIFWKSSTIIDFLNLLPKVQSKHQSLTIKRNEQQGHLAKAQIINPGNYQSLTTKKKLYLKV